MTHYKVTDADIRKAVYALDPDKSEHWTATCVPLIAAVNDSILIGGTPIGGDRFICRKDIERVAPGWNRKKAADAKYNGSGSVGVEEIEVVKFQIPFARLNGVYMNVLRDTFKLTDPEITEINEKRGDQNYVKNYSQGVRFICTKGQFGDFIISRNVAGLQNLIQELRADRVGKKRVMSAQSVAEGFNISRKVVEAIIVVVESLGYVRPDDVEWVSDKIIDVSER